MNDVTVGANDLTMRVGPVRIAHHRLDMILQSQTLELHGGPAPSLSFDDFVGSMISDNKIVGKVYPSGTYNAGPNIPISPPEVISEGIDTAIISPLPTIVISDANKYFAGHEYAWFGPNSNTYFQYVMLNYAARLLRDRRRIKSVEVDLHDIYQPGFYPWSDIVLALPAKLQSLAGQYASKLLPVDDPIPDLLLERISDWSTRLLDMIEKALNYIKEGSTVFPEQIETVARQLIDVPESIVKKLSKLLRELERVVGNSVKQVVKVVKRVIDEIVDWFGL